MKNIQQFHRKKVFQININNIKHNLNFRINLNFKEMFKKQSFKGLYVFNLHSNEK